MEKYFNKIKIINSLLVVVLLFGMFPVVSVSARTSEDVGKEIEEKEQELQEINKQLESAQESLDKTQSKKNSAVGIIAGLEAEISLLEENIAFNEIKIRVLEESKNIKELEKEQREVVQSKQIEESYISWKSEDDKFVSMMLNSENPVKTATYYDLIAMNGQAGIEELAKELKSIEDDYASFSEEYDDLQSQFAMFEEQIIQKRAEIDKINQAIASESKKLSSTKQQANKTKAQIDQLYDEQKAIQEYEAWLLEQGGDNDDGGGDENIVAGEYYFSGRGRDAVQGHGVGLSQNGALGAALAGWSYKQIIEFYYQGAKIVKYTSRDTLPVKNYGEMNIETYVAGIGEVPSYGCEDLGVNFGDKGYWGCWPKEAIKAQIVAARSYAISYTSGGYPICTTASCQVYIGGTAKQALAEETKHEVPMVNNVPIKAFYSANNNQGKGTADNDTVWSNKHGYGTPYSYLRSVNDHSFYYPAPYSGCGGGDCSTWSYKTNSYEMSDIEGMLRWAGSSSSNNAISSGNKAFVNEILGNVGELSALNFVRDPSGRVKRVVFAGTNGSDEMAGWLFKSIWNIWVSEVRPSGQVDYIYSLSFYLLKG